MSFACKRLSLRLGFYARCMGVLGFGWGRTLLVRRALVVLGLLLMRLIRRWRLMLTHCLLSMRLTG